MSIYTRIPARKYYGRWRAGSVILRNGYPIFHGNPSEATRLLTKLEGGAKLGHQILPFELVHLLNHQL